jgi:hypothetical protein
MSFSEHFLSGFALAATIAKDPAAQRAHAGLAASVVAPLTRVARELVELSKAERRARIRGWTEPASCQLPEAPAQPVRAFALLAHRSAGGSIPLWLRSAPLPRAGYAPDRQLTSLLLRMAAQPQPRSQPEPPHASAKEPGGEWGE